MTVYTSHKKGARCKLGYGSSTSGARPKARPALVDAQCKVKGASDVLPICCAQDPPGKVPRINATVGEPLGARDPEHSPLCRAFQAPRVRSVAIVGNGPLNDAQRKEIDTFDVVVRSCT